MDEEEELVGLRLISGKQCIAQALANSHIMFLGATHNNHLEATKI